MTDAVSMGSAAASVIIVLCSALGGLFAAYATYVVSLVKTDPNLQDESSLMPLNADKSSLVKVHDITNIISEGATAFLMAEYRYMAIFIVGFGAIILILLSVTDTFVNALFSTLAFILGSTTSILAGFIGMRIAVYANGRTTLMAAKGYPQGFQTAFRGGIVMGFALTSLGLFNLFIGIILFKLHYGKNSEDLYGSIAAYGLGGSSIALFGRVGGGIFTKAADVGADLVGKVEQGIPEDDPRNPGVIADCIGDNVGDIAGMGSDLFGSFAEATCASLVIGASIPALEQSWASMMFPLLITASGIVVCALTSVVATDIRPAHSKESIEPTLKQQLLISTVLATVALLILSLVCLPSSFKVTFINQKKLSGGAAEQYDVKNWYCFVAVASGLWAGLAIGYITEYFTSSQYSPVVDVADACRTGAATNVIHGLALGYKSTIIPTFAMAGCVYVSYNLCGMYGIALGALGILSTMAIGLTIDGYGPISDNAGGIAEMAGMGKEVRDRTDALDAAGNTTAAIGKGYAIGSAALVALALYGAFLTRAFADTDAAIVNILDPRTFFGLLIGAMLPYWFSAMTMKSVGLAAMEMVTEIQHQFKTIPGLMDGTGTPDYKKCVKIATDASLSEMLAPGALVVLSPIIMGIFFGREALAGLLPGALISGVQLAISASNTGGAWDNAKKYVEAGGMGPGMGKGSEVHHAAVIGDTVGDPLKDTSGPALNILIKLMAIISVVFAPVVEGGKPTAGLIFDKLFSTWAARDDTIHA